MELFSVCIACDAIKSYDGNRQFGDVDSCAKCGEKMDVYTKAGVRNENNRRFYEGRAKLGEGIK